ncbi:MAG: hypothetical protein HZB19_04955 [Chloroflexi bacterium]|nr:hypothetical protein [Chloroflexota bacterium]
MNDKWVDWDKPITLVSTMAQELKISEEKLRLFRRGVFKFNDGTTQGWTLDQLYDTTDKTMTKLSPFTHPTTGQFFGFTLGNYQNLGLAASGNPVVVLAGPNVTSIDFYLESPDLLNNQDWKNLNGYSLDMQRNYFSLCGDIGTYCLQLQVQVWDLGQKVMKIYGEYDAATKQFVFHKIDAQKPYHLVWTADIFTDPNLQLRFLRLRFTQPNYTTPGSGECLPKGAWLVTNISPE